MHIAAELHKPVEPQYSVNFSGKVISEPVYNMVSERIICNFRLSEIAGVPSDDYVRLYLRSEVLPLEGIEYGQTLVGNGHIWPADAATNPHEFDFQQYLLTDGVNGMAAAKLEDISITANEKGFGGWIISVRNALSEKIERLFPGNPDLAKAFILGDRSGMEEDLRENFRRTGITHLICISGMHISVLAGAVSWLLMRWLHRNTSVIIAVLMCLIYGVFLGFPASLVRATILFAIFSFAPVVGRPSDSVTNLSLALLLMLVFNPMYIYDTGFALSFWAAGGIILLKPSIARLFKVDVLEDHKFKFHRMKRPLRRAILYFPELLCTTLSAQIATLPIIIGSFGAQSLLSLPVNLVAIPLAMLAYPLAFAALCLALILPSVGAIFATLPDALFSVLSMTVDVFAELPISEFRVQVYPWWLFAVHCILILGGSDLSRISASVRKYCLLPIAALTGVSILCAWMGTLGFTITFLDADQADSAVLRADGCVAVFDTGDPYSPVTDYVSAACTGVDAVFLSHPHYDHAGGLFELLETIPPKTIYIPSGWFDVDADEDVSEGISLAMQMGIPIVELRAGDCVELTDELSVLVHSPSGEMPTVNDLSLLLEVRCGNVSAMFSGDLTAECEPAEIPDIDILKVAHHGSRYASSSRFLEAASPQVAVISVGENNYGHPSDETLQRLADVGAGVYRTDISGAIFVTADSDGTLSVNTYFPREEIS